jgi:nucleoporin NDC1
MIPLVNWNLGLLTIGPAVTAPFAYLPFRQIVWSNTLWVARSFYWLNRSTALPPYPVGPGLFIRSTVVAAMIVLSAEVAHVAFTVYFLEQPFANNKLISDKSPNPNGTLITGLRTSKAPLTQSFAFWELDFLSSERPDRRKAIYNDVDRKPSTTWEQILSECLRTLSEVDTSVFSLIIPPAPEPVTPPAENLALTAPLSSPPPIPMSPAPFVSTGRSPGRSFVESMQSTTGETPDKLLRSRLPPLPEEMNAPIVQARENLNSLKEYTVPMLASTFGYPLRHTIARTTSAAIPNHRLVCHAISALAKLTVASLEEDDYGVVQNHVVGILKAFLETLETLERFLEKPPIHWTDTESKLIMEQGGKPEMIEAEEVAKELKDAIKEIGGAFRPHFEDMGCPRELQNKVATVLGIYYVANT